MKSSPEKNPRFKVLKIKLDEDSSIREILVKGTSFQPRSMNNEYADHPKLHLINLPRFLTKNHLKSLFRKCGKIIEIFISKPSMNNYRESLMEIGISLIFEKEDENSLPIISDSCYLVFENINGVEKAIEMANSGETFCISSLKKTSDTHEHGVKLWQMLYNNSIQSPEQMKKNAELFLKKMSENESTNKGRDEEESIGEDGWIKVNRKLRRNRRALVNDRYHDQMIEEKYENRVMKRLNEEKEFDEQLEPIIKKAFRPRKKII